jgi:hypothetical protein
MATVRRTLAACVLRLAAACVLLAAACGQSGGARDGGGGADAGPDAATACRAAATAAPGFGEPVALSTAGASAFLPSIATRGSATLIAWHEFVGSAPRIAYSVAQDGCVGALELLPEPAARALRPKVAATASGWVIAYVADDGTGSVVRAALLAPDGSVVTGPETIAPGFTVSVAAAGDDVAYVWFDGAAHRFALRGPSETVAPSPVGTTLVDITLLNLPVAALAPDGTLFVAHRDGGTTAADWDVLLAARPRGGTFGAEADVSSSPGLLSDDISLAVDADGTLEIAWVDQDPIDVNAFEVNHATRAPSGALSAPELYGAQGLWSWTPSVTPGGAAAWRTGQGARGPLSFAAPPSGPQAILAPRDAAQLALALAHPGTAAAPAASGFELAFTDGASPPVLFYARQP